ncbi:MAG: amidohydrolase [Microbacteriaceae bacterium]|nr:amidohydrolase [Microbacteriaceae bacterium]
MSLVLRNARVSGELTDIVIGGGTITAIAPGLSAGESIDLDGRHVIPGLWDEHVHFGQHALAQRRIDLSGARSAREAADLMAAAVAAGASQPGLPLAGAGFRDGLWPDQPTAQLLDAVVGDEPIVLVSGDLHCCWLNSAALAFFGVASHPTGVLREDEAFPITNALRNVPTDLLDAWVSDAAALAATRGVVGVVDFEMSDNLVDWQRRVDAGFDWLRVDLGFYPEHLDAAIAAKLHTGKRLGELLAVGPFKIISDGSLNTRTAFCVDEYPGLAGHPNSHGILTVPSNVLRPLLQKAKDAGFLPAVHAIGDEANRLALDAFEAVGCRGRIEHAQLLLEVDYPRFAELGVVASVQPEQAMDDRDVADRHWAGRTGRAFVMRSLLDAGARLLLGSDAPVAPLDPWVSVSAAVGRSRDGLAPWHPEQAITVGEALAASTRTTVSVGQVADLAIVDLDPFAASPDELRSMPVAGTLLGGSFTHRTF